MVHMNSYTNNYKDFCKSSLTLASYILIIRIHTPVSPPNFKTIKFMSSGQK